MEKNQTSKILMEDEQVLGTYRPNFWKLILTNVLIFIIFMAFLTIFFVLGELTGEEMTTEFTANYPLIKGVVFGGVSLLFLLILGLQLLAYRNRFYTVTNKRLIIQRGLIGIDFQSIPLNAVQYLSVSVTVVDKILRQGTGTIVFGTMSTPVNPSQGAKFVFTNLNQVYENYRYFKSLVDQSSASSPK
ncbi:MAG: PH domain-containing protein [Bacilli bacterium]